MGNLIPFRPQAPATFESISHEDLIQAFFSGKSERTIRAYQQDLKTFCEFLGTDSVKEASKELLRSHPQGNRIALSYKQHMCDKGLQPTTVNRRLAALRSLVAMGRTLGLVSWKLEIKNERTTAYRDTKGPGTTAFQEMIAVTDARKDTKGIRDKAILRLLFDLGLRRGEVVSLDIDDVDLEKRTIWIMGKGKTQKQALTLPQRTMDVLQAWLERRGSDPGPLFTNMDRARKGDGRISGTSIYRLVRDLGEKIGVKTRPHGIRHSAITVALKKAQAHQIDLEEVLDFSRHADVKTMMLYRDRERNVQGKLSELVSDSV